MRFAYVDSCIFIYWVEKTALESEAALNWLNHNRQRILCVSPLVRLEVLVKPERLHQAELVAAYESLLATQKWLTINDEIFARALSLRAHFGLKTPDALHLATAQHYECDEFWTNDNRLALAAGSMAINILSG